VDVSNPTMPQLLTTVNVAANRVVVVEGVAYAAVDSELQSFDLLTGEHFQSLSLGPLAITALAHDGSFLYAMDAGHTLDLIASSGPWNLLGGTLTGGISVSGLVFTTSGGVLDGVTAQGDLDLTQDYGVFANVRNGLTLDGSTVRLRDTGASPTYGYLYFDGTQELGGTGGVLFGSSGSNALYSLTSGTTLTLAAGVTVHGAGGTLYGNLVNQGAVAADAAGPGLFFRPYNTGDTFTNQGTIHATNGGSLDIADFQPNAGLLSAGAGSIIVIHGPFTQAAGGTTRVEIGGANTTAFGQISVDDAATLAGTLDLALVNGFAPAVGDSFTILTFASLSGTFDTVNDTDLGGGHSFVVTYNPTDLTVTVS
jgi:hypothetical protein